MNNMSFEESLEKLDKIVKNLESGNVELDKAIEEYTEAMKMVKFCSEKLDKATKQVNKILSDNELKDFQVTEEE